MKKAFLFLLALTLGAALFAQGAPKAGALGVTGTVGSGYFAIGAWYNITDAIVIKPAIGINNVSNPDQNATYKETQFTAIASLDALYELPIAEDLALGLGPRISYYSTSLTDTFTTGPNYTEKTTNFDLGAVASVQYFLAKGLGIYLDLSVVADFQTHTPNTGSSYTVTTIGTGRSGLGLVLFLK